MFSQRSLARCFCSIKLVVTHDPDLLDPFQTSSNAKVPLDALAQDTERFAPLLAFGPPLWRRDLTSRSSPTLITRISILVEVASCISHRLDFPDDLDLLFKGYLKGIHTSDEVVMVFVAHLFFHFFEALWR